jgi:hypothetical protein
MNKTIEQAQAAKISLLRHFGIMFVVCAALQVIIAVRGSHIDLVSQLLLAGVGLYYVWYHYTSRNLLRRMRFGRLVAHIVGYLIVNVSYHLHAMVLFISGSAAIKGTGAYLIDEGWFGVLFGMATAWGVILLTHLATSIASRGFEGPAKD